MRSPDYVRRAAKSLRDFATAKNVARKLALKLQQGQKSPAGGAFCQYALKLGVMTVNATEVASDTPVRQNESPLTSPPL